MLVRLRKVFGKREGEPSNVEVLASLGYLGREYMWTQEEIDREVRKEMHLIRLNWLKAGVAQHYGMTWWRSMRR